MYEWRKMSERQRMQVLVGRQKNLRPWHRPPHFTDEGFHCYHVSSACYEHRPVIGMSPARMAEFESKLVEVLSSRDRKLYAWCILPNHWHALVHADHLPVMTREIGQLHGRASFQWNGEDAKRGRKCWHSCADRRIRSVRHFHVAQNYIHHNPVKHGFVEKWEDWPFSSATAYLQEMGRDVVLQEWKEYPVLEMGTGWDD